ncbi:MAG: glycosyltransferase family 4 protein [Anaerolineales bacterium]
MSTRLLIISPEAPGQHMSGPAIRYWEMAQALDEEHTVTLAVPDSATQTSTTFRVMEYDRETGAGLQPAAKEAGVLYISGLSLYRYPFLRELSQPLVVDLYDPFLFETLEIHTARPLPEQLAYARHDLSVLDELLRRGDLFLCASDTQRDFWLGMLAGAGRINPQTFQADRTLRRLIDVAPFGLPEVAPVQIERRLTGRHPGIAETDRVIYWGGGLWEWFDPLTAIRAMPLLCERHPEAKLFFAGVRHPNPDVPAMRMAAAAQSLSAELGLTGQTVFFNDWVPYTERADYLLEADVGLSLHFDHIETRFAFRTRLLDYVWVGLPMVVTRGDILGEQAAGRGLARLVPPGDVAAVAGALAEWLESADDRATVQTAARRWAGELRWSTAVRPLAEFCRAPRRAADVEAVAAPGLRPGLIPQAWRSLRTRGLYGLWRDVRAYLNLR